jgi:hypothetical protein
MENDAGLLWSPATLTSENLAKLESGVPRQGCNPAGIESSGLGIVKLREYMRADRMR